MKLVRNKQRLLNKGNTHEIKHKNNKTKGENFLNIYMQENEKQRNKGLPKSEH